MFKNKNLVEEHYKLVHKVSSLDWSNSNFMNKCQTCFEGPTDDDDVKSEVKSEIKTDIKTEIKNEIKSEIKTEIKKEPLDEMDEIFKRGNDLLLQRKTKKEAESEEKDDVFKKVDKILNKSKTKTQNTPLKGPQNNSKIESPPKLNLQPALTPFNGMVMEVSVFFLFI